ncbi:MAG: hypothetical protein EXS10_09440 [Phycisphaerales bacterium]|nr:hypothetical protein [Phycisphaerales bacterium]
MAFVTTPSNGAPEFDQVGLIERSLAVRQEFTPALYQSLFRESRDGSLLTSEANPSIAGTQPLGMLQLSDSENDCCDQKPCHVGWITVVASMPLPIAHTSTAQTPEGEITLSYRLEEADFLLALGTGWCERVTGLLMHMEIRHPISGRGALTVVLPLSILEGGSAQTFVANRNMGPMLSDGTLMDTSSCERNLVRQLTDCDTEHSRRKDNINGEYRDQLQLCINGWEVFQDAAIGAAAGGLCGIIGTPLLSAICAIGGAGVGILWGVTECYNSAVSRRDQALADSALRQNDCLDDAALSFERCVEDARLGVGQ